jgi:lysophospholipase L1-like esterase
VTSPPPPSAIRRALAVLAALVVVVLAAPAGAAPAQDPAATAPEESTAPGAGGGPTVFVLGDSVILGAQGEIEATLAAAGFTVLFDATVGRTTRGGLEEVLRRRAEIGDTIVIMLGHNDGADPQIFAPDADALLAELDDVPRVLWLTIHEVKDYYVETNRLLGAVAAGRDNVQVVDWSTVADRPGVTNPDGLHLTPTGAQTMADLVLAAVRGTASSPTTAGPPTSTSVAGVAETAPAVTAPAGGSTTAPAAAGPEAAAPASASDRDDGGPSATGTALLVASALAAIGGLVVRRHQLASRGR